MAASELVETTEILQKLSEAMQTMQNVLHEIEKTEQILQRREQEGQVIPEVKKKALDTAKQHFRKTYLKDFENLNIDKILKTVEDLPECRLISQKIQFKKRELKKQQRRLFPRSQEDSAFSTPSSSTAVSSSGEAEDSPVQPKRIVHRRSKIPVKKKTAKQGTTSSLPNLPDSTRTERRI